MSEISTLPPEDDESQANNDRRAFLGKAAVAAAVSAVAGLSISKQASAANGDAMLVGGIHTGTTTTSLSGGTTFRVTDGGSTGINGGINPRVGSIYGRQAVSGRAGVMGEATGTSGGWAVYGRNSSSTGIGVYGLNVASGGAGVYGEHRASSTEESTGIIGVATTSSNGVGVSGSGALFDLRGASSGKLFLTSATVTATAAGTAGTVARDATGNMWVAVANNSWRKIAGPASAGAFHAVTPGRVYDSREALPNPGTLSTGANRTVSVASRRNIVGGAVVDANFVPANARAITCNVTAIAAAGPGFLAVNPGGTTAVNAASVNWTAAGQIVNNGVTAAINSATRQVTVVCGGAGVTHFVIDVTGYFL